ncbi:ABC transporter permease [Gemmatimonadota bacterium]
MDTLRQNLKLSLKLLLKERSFTITALFTLALCIGANSAIFSAVNTLLLRPLPFEDSDRLVIVFNLYPRAQATKLGCSVPDYFARREGIDAFEDVAIFGYLGRTVGEAEAPRRVFTLGVSHSLLPVLRVEPILGRNFTEEEEYPENGAVVILGYDYWQTHFNGDESVLGREMRIDGRTHTVVGVLPEGFRQLDEWPAEIYVPLALSQDARDIANLHTGSVNMIARLAPGATIELAEEQITAVNETLLEAWPAADRRQMIRDTGFHSDVEELQEALMGQRRPAFILLMIGAVLVLVIGCVNIAHLMVARLTVRRQEFATRIALGARRRQLYRQIMTESLLLGISGGVLSLGVAMIGLRVMNVLRVDEIPFGGTIALDGTVLLFTLLTSILTGIIFGILPLFQLLRTDLHTVFRYDGRTVTSSRRITRYRNLMAIIQVATAFILLAGSGLLLSSFRTITRIEPGFHDPASILNGFIDLPAAQYPDDDSWRQFITTMLEEVQALPGVEHAAITSRLPFVTFEQYGLIIPEDYTTRVGESFIPHRQAIVSPDYFRTMGIPLVTGRDFGSGDTRDTIQSIIIDQWMADHYWPGGDPVGKRMYSGAAATPVEERDEMDFYTVIGVVGSVRYSALTESDAGGRGAFYRTYTQSPTDFMLIAIRTGLDPLSLTPTVQKVITSMDPELPFYLPTTLEDRISDTLMEHRTPMVLITLFAILSLFLAAIGLYGVLVYQVNQRTREFGIRVALGSTRKELSRLILADGIRTLVIGLGVGVAATFLLAGMIRNLLFEVVPSDPVVIGSSIVILGTVTVLSCLIPARRVTRIDPVRALNYD